MKVTILVDNRALDSGRFRTEHGLAVLLQAADHTGGLPAFLQVNEKAKVIVSPAAVSGSFFSTRGALHSITANWPLERMEGRTMEKYPGTTFYTSHCTEDGAFRTLKAVMGEHLHHFHCGEIF